MGVPQLDSCCCGCTLKTGTKIIGWLQLIGSILIVIMLATSLASLYHAEEHPTKDTEPLLPYIPALKTMAIIGIISQSIQCVFGIVLLLGVYQNKAQFLFFWVVGTLATSIMELVTTFSQIFTFYEQSHPISILGFIVNLYFILVVYSYYRNIKNGSANYA